MIFQAHKGVSTENPENTMPALVAAKEQGYGIIELDVGITKDKKFVLLHDKSINRTARDANGQSLCDTVSLADLTYEETLGYDFGIWFSKKFKGTNIPLFSDVLDFAKRESVFLKIDNKYQKFSEEDKKIFFELLKPYGAVASLTCKDLEALKEAADTFPNMHLHYDGAVSDEILESIGKIISKERVTVWLPLKNDMTSWVKTAYATPELAEAVKKHARLGIWIISTKDELLTAEALGAEVVETNGQLKPQKQTTWYADMHTHSEHSHDSSCKIEDMARANAKLGTGIFAVTDHFDTASHKTYDVFTPIKKGHAEIAELRKKYPSELILRGIEISEGFRAPEIAKKAREMLDYDVIIGSVHLVRHPRLNYAYSAIDFGALAEEEIYDFLDCYFDDMLTMLEKDDFDILAHLTCPLRYINGKYKRGVSLERYGEKITKILKKIISSGIALEVNTSSIDMLGDFMPGANILKEYRKLGGYLITLGSDAHVEKNASFGFGAARNALRTLGFENIYYYKNRKPYQIEI